METIPKQECIKVGYIRKVHGVQGELILEYEPEYEEPIAEAERFFLKIDGLLVPFFLNENGLRFKSVKTAIVSFDGVNNEETARRITGSAVFLYEKEIVSEENDDSASLFSGYRLFDENARDLGFILAVDNYSGNVVFTLEYSGRELLIPYNRELLLELDNERKIIRLRLPEGLLDE